jgi:hypothetical protein
MQVTINMKVTDGALRWFCAGRYTARNLMGDCK